MERLLEQQSALRLRFKASTKETESIKKELDLKTEELMVLWRKEHPVYWTIKCTATASGRYVDFDYYRGKFATEESAIAALKEADKTQRMSNHTLSYRVVPVSTAGLRTIPSFDTTCSLWHQ